MVEDFGSRCSFRFVALGAIALDAETSLRAILRRLPRLNIGSEELNPQSRSVVMLVEVN